MATFSNQQLPIVLNSLEDKMVIDTTSFFSSHFDNPPQQLLKMPLQFHQNPYTIDASPSPNIPLNDHLQLTPMLTNITHFPKVVKNAAMSKNAEKKKHQNNKKGKIKINKVPPTEYIHVRARRGQATDSHSLAERVRREKINEKMRFLQSIVPGCDKVIGKTQILDEIINYIQSLQYQVEFLFGKLSSITPMINDFQSDFDTTTLLSEENDIHLWEINMLSPL